MIQGLAVLATAIGPVVAAASAGALGIAGAAGTALVAFKGIKDQMEAGVGYGAQLKSAFSGVSSVVDALAAQVADAVGPGLLASVDAVREALPSFSGLFRAIGGSLGAIAQSATRALLNVFGAAQPLILEVVGYLQQGAQRLASWTGSAQFKEFLAYAGRELPIVGGLVSSVAKALVTGFVAFAPIGEGVIQILTGLANAASSVFGFIGGIVQGVAGFFGADFAKQTQAQTGFFAGLTTQLQALNGVVTTTSTTSTGLAAILGVTDAAYKTASDAVAANADQLAATTLQMRLQNDAAGLLKQSLDALSGKTLGVEQSYTSFQTGLLAIDDTFAKARFSATDFTDAAVAQRTELQQLVTAAQAHAEAVGTQTNSTQAATAALAADYAQILQNTGATGANRDAIQAYIQQIGAIPPVALTQLEINTAQATAQAAAFSQYITHLPPGTASVILDTAAATASLQRFISTPRETYVQVVTVTPNGVFGGKQALSAYGNIFDTVGHYAAGGIIDGLAAKMRASVPHFANGAENHVPQIAMPNGGVRVWAEPETQGEAYIPFALDRRARAEDIVSQVASRFGGAYVRPTSMRAPSGSVVPAAGGSGGDLLAAIGALTARVGDVETAVYAGASHVGDRYDGAVSTQTRTVGLAAQQTPRRG